MDRNRDESKSTPGNGTHRWRKALSMVALELGRTLQYVYFLRFCLSLWLFPYLLVWLNQTPLRTLTSGIVTPEEFPQYICVAFLVVSSGFVALISARVVLINGRARFRAEPPFLLRGLLAYEGSKFAWLVETVALLLSQTWNFFVFGYLISNGKFEHVKGGTHAILWGIVCGGVLAGLLWWVINAIFYATYEIREEASEAAARHERSHSGEKKDRHSEANILLGVNAARTILFPRWCFLLAPVGASISDLTDTLEGFTTPMRSFGTGALLSRPVGWGKRIVGYQGYSKTESSRLFEAHAFSIAAFGVSLVLYAFIGAATAPVPLVGLTIGLFALMLIFIAILCVVLARLRRRDGVASTQSLIWSFALILLVLVFVGFLGAVYCLGDPERFPSFGLLIILAIALNWMLSGLAFWADRYRVPVFLAIVTAMAIPRFFGWVGAGDEHFISTAPAQSNAQLRSPYDIFEAFSERSGDQPAIIVTATGGGLHASAWTVAVLSQLENRFKDEPGAASGESFHNHLLLASSVSGGSIGLMAYLDQLQRLKQNPTPADAPDFGSKASMCSSLEAVTWGLLYYDLPKAFLPVLPHFIAPDSGLSGASGQGTAETADLDKSPLFKDRTWALRKGFARNLRSKYCKDSNSNLIEDLSERPDIEKTEQSLTLGHLLSAGQDPYTPAFTMNTTTVEGGARFLLANYELPADKDNPLFQEKLGGNESYPAQSFLDEYRTGNDKKQSLDLPLATAAQMSGTFPYVSSAARIPMGYPEFAEKQFHFIDGGYYDNDGTASAIEFLRSLLKNRVKQRQEGKTECDSKKDGQAKQACEKKLAELNLPVRILLVEIRNSGDPEDDRPPSSKDPWSIGGQLLGPLLGLWNGGHESVTQRNRVALDLLQQAFPPQELELQRVVMADDCTTKDEYCRNEIKNKTDPLNWSLTPAQREEIACSSTQIEAGYLQIMRWFHASGEEWKTGNLPKMEDPKISPCPHNP